MTGDLDGDRKLGPVDWQIMQPRMTGLDEVLAAIPTRDALGKQAA